MNPTQLNLLLDYIDEVIRLNGHSHHGTSPFAQVAETGFPKPEIEKLKHELRDAVFQAEQGVQRNGVIIEGEFTRIGD